MRFYNCARRSVSAKVQLETYSVQPGRFERGESTPSVHVQAKCDTTLSRAWASSGCIFRQCGCHHSRAACLCVRSTPRACPGTPRACPGSVCARARVMVWTGPVDSKLTDVVAGHCVLEVCVIEDMLLEFLDLGHPACLAPNFNWRATACAHEQNGVRAEVSTG